MLLLSVFVIIIWSYLDIFTVSLMQLASTLLVCWFTIRAWDSSTCVYVCLWPWMLVTCWYLMLASLYFCVYLDV